jgi:hypothetical protein
MCSIFYIYFLLEYLFLRQHFNIIIKASSTKKTYNDNIDMNILKNIRIIQCLSMTMLLYIAWLNESTWRPSSWLLD